MKLEDRIKALLESAEGTKSEEELIESAKGDDGKTDFSKDPGVDDEKEGVEVDAPKSDDEGKDEDEKEDEKEEKDETVKEDFSVDKYNKNHLLPGMNRRDKKPEALKEPTADAKVGDNGDTARLKVGLSRKDGSGPEGQKTDGQNPDNKKNDVRGQEGTLKGMKTDVKEHIDAMLSGQELSEEFREKAGMIFEAAVSSAVEQRLAEEIETIQEDFQVKLEEAVDEVQGELVEHINGFLDRVVDEWISDNAVALESGIKVEMVSDFIDGLKSLFNEHHIEVPEDKLNIVEEQAEKIGELESSINEAKSDYDAVLAENAALKRKIAISECSEGLSMTQKEKFDSLCGGVEFVSEGDFMKRIKTIKESYFQVAAKPVKDVAVPAQPAVSITEDVNKYVDVLSKPLKFS